MKIETKYDINQKVWFIDDNAVMDLNVSEINITIKSEKPSIRYTIVRPIGNNSTIEIKKDEFQIFATKEELISNL